MTREGQNRFLHEAMGLCWHKSYSRQYGNVHTCLACGKLILGRIDEELERERFDFFTWPGFGVAWEWAQLQPWFGTFLRTVVPSIDKDNMVIYCSLVHRETFAPALVAFLKGRE